MAPVLQPCWTAPAPGFGLNARTRATVHGRRLVSADDIVVLAPQWLGATLEEDKRLDVIRAREEHVRLCVTHHPAGIQQLTSVPFEGEVAA